ncbi:MAG: hypothetical protein IT337_15250 [Thermomicrobiales bacterium]|nr:hypothetical protein [Thermomicrobiales bacterium]
MNLTTLFVFGAGAITFYVGVLRMRDTMRDIQKAVEHWKLSFLALQAEHKVFKEDVIKDYVRRQDFDPVVQQLFDKIDQNNRDQLAAINRIYDRLLDDAKDDRRPAPRR